jgi:uracil-DNA glycosylase family 4
VKPKPPACSGCPWERRGRSYVPGCGPLNAQVAFIGQGPGQHEAATGTPFHPEGASGRLLTSWLDMTGFPRDTVWIDNAVRCWITSDEGDEAPPAAVLECRRRHWGPALLTLPYLRAVVAVGVPSARTLLGDWASARTAGTFNEVEFTP